MCGMCNTGFIFVKLDLTIHPAMPEPETGCDGDGSSSSLLTIAFSPLLAKIKRINIALRIKAGKCKYTTSAPTE